MTRERSPAGRRRPSRSRRALRRWAADHQPVAHQRRGRRGRRWPTRRDVRRRLPRRPRRPARLGRRPGTGARPGGRGTSAGWSRPTPRRWPRLVTREIGKPLRRGARRGARDRRHLRLLPRRGAPALRPDGAQRDARQAAVHLPRCRSAPWRWSPPATSRSRCRPGTSSRRCCAGNTVVWKPAEYAAASAAGVLRAARARRRAAGRRAEHRARRRRRRPSTAWSRRWRDGLVDKVGFTGSSAVGGAHRRARRAAPAVGLPGAGRQEPDGGHAPTPTSTWPSRARCSPASAPAGSAAPRWAR